MNGRDVLIAADQAATARTQLARLQHLAALQRRADTIRARLDADQHRRYADTPSAFMTECMMLPDGRTWAPYQTAALDDLAQFGRVAVRGPRGMGKTAIAAAAVHWFARTRDALGLDWKILTTAGVFRHLYRALWPEVHRWSPTVGGIYAPLRSDRELLTAAIQLPHGQAFAAVAKNPDLIESAHADELLIIIDEAKSVIDPIWDALEGSLTAPTGQYVLALSTPGPPAGRFYDIHCGRLDGWRARHVTVDDAQAAGRVSAESIRRRAAYWGTESALYRQQVLGEFAADDDGAIIPLSWVEAAMERWHAWKEDGRPPVEGDHSYAVDVATTGADATVIAHRIGAHIVELIYTRSNTAMAVVAKIQGAIPADRKGAPIVVDAAGVGTGVASRLEELGYRVVRYTGSSRTSARTRDGSFGFANVRGAAYWRLRERLAPDADTAIMLPPHEQLTADLTTPTWDELTGDPPKIRMEEKKHLTARLGRSPDYGDAVAMAYWLDALRVKVEAPDLKQVRRLPRRGLSPLDP